MTHTTRRGIVALLFASMISGLSAQGARPSDADLKEIASYKLTMETLEKVKVATRAMIAEIRHKLRIARLSVQLWNAPTISSSAAMQA